MPEMNARLPFAIALMLALESHHTPKFDRTTALAQASEGTMHGFFPTVEPSRKRR